MLHRLPIVLASLTSLLAACADDATIAGDGPTRPDVVDGVDGVDAPRPGGDGAPAKTTCLARDGIFKVSSWREDAISDVHVTATGSIVAVGHRYGALGSGGTDGIPDGARETVLEIAPDLASAQDRSAALSDAYSGSVRAIAADPTTGRRWLSAPHPSRMILGELPTSGRARQLLSLPAYNMTTPHAIAVGPRGDLAIAGEERALLASGATEIRSSLWVLKPGTTPWGEAEMRLHVSWTRGASVEERLTAVAVGATSLAVGGAAKAGERTGMFVESQLLDAGLIWARQLSTSGADRLASVVLLPDGDVLWAGTSAEALGGEAHGGTDLIVGRLDGATGEPVWTRQLGTAFDDRAADLAVLPDGRYLLVGDVGTERGDTDVVTFTLDDDGVRATEQWGAAGDERVTAVALDSCGAAAISGHTTGDFGGAPAGGRDGFVLVTGVQ